MNSNKSTRRDWLAAATGAAVSVTLAGKLKQAVADARSAGLRIGMCDWSMRRQDTSAFELAKQIGLNGVEVSIGTEENKLWLRRPEIQKQYLEAAQRYGMAIPSIAMGLLNDVPLMSEPRAALWAADTIEVAKALGARVILLAFFIKGELKEQNTDDMRRVTEVLAELAPRAEKAGVILALESMLSAEAHLKIINAVQSKQIKVYYDAFNAASAGHDVLKEIKLLGREHICQVHFKDKPSLGEPTGKVDWPATVAALKAIRYDGWIVLETPCPNDVLSDTKKNVALVRQWFA